MLNHKRIFIESSPGIGDLIELTPVLRAIKEKYPAAILTVCSRNPFSLETIDRIPYIDATHRMDGSPWGRWKSFLCFLKQDYVLFNSYQGALVRLARLAGVRHRAGNCKEKHWNSGMFTVPYPYTNQDSINIHETDYFAQKFGKGLGERIEIKDYQVDVSEPNEAEMQSAKSILEEVGIEDDNYVIVNLYANTSIDFSNDTIETILRYWGKSHKLVLTGKRNEKLEALLRERQISQNIHLVMGKTSIMEMIAMVKMCKFVVSIDTGIIHIASALRKKTLGIWTQGGPVEWLPKHHVMPCKLPLECGLPHCKDPHCTDPKCARLPKDFLEEHFRKFETEWLQ
ncbi:glycosyltransferase family 9 protein [Selenomonas sp. TAMA-11512]|uniref:glycosyltransferase family 9 protein n=1 Tax=Selenomonas sp. TAMA-11512 TaxID=3095337 RepID=UPI003087A50B|nr:glycosyltransferase family 9 protein [Selenomonas sp. TAMA-11512]